MPIWGAGLFAFSLCISTPSLHAKPTCRQILSTFIPYPLETPSPTSDRDMLVERWRQSHHTPHLWTQRQELELLLRIVPDLEPEVTAALRSKVLLRWPLGVSWKSAHYKRVPSELLFRRLIWLAERILVYSRSHSQRHIVDLVSPRAFGRAYTGRKNRMNDIRVKLLKFFDENGLSSGLTLAQTQAEKSRPPLSPRRGFVLGMARTGAILATFTFVGMDLHDSLYAQELVEEISKETRASEDRTRELREINQKTSAALEKLKSK